MRLKNRTFAHQSEYDHRRKLRIVLRQLTADYLTEEQRFIIEEAVWRKQQYHMRLYTSPRPLCHMIGKGSAVCKGVETKTLFGSLDNPPMAILERHTSRERPKNIIHIYLRNENEEE